ncbi:MAG: prolyl oligopeptidase family serine peptidase [Hyphomicrobiaceae bacterium]
MTKEIRPYGCWPSPITTEMVAGQSRRFGSLQGVGPWIWWSEGRPGEQGRTSLMRGRANRPPEDVLPPPFSARSRVHEYGGGEFFVVEDTIYFVNDPDQDIYRLVVGGTPERVTNAENFRFADFTLDETRNRLIAVAETVPPDSDSENGQPENSLATILLDQSRFGRIENLVTGRDFYAAPRLSPDGGKLAWLDWQLPDMPWDQAELHVGEFDASGQLGRAKSIAGGDGNAVFQPEWGPDGRLYFVSDKSGTGKLYVWDGDTVDLALQCDGDLSRPLWALGTRSYAIATDGSIAATTLVDGVAQFVFSSGKTREPKPVALPVRGLENVIANDSGFGAIVTRDDEPPAVAHISVETSSLTTLRASAEIDLDSGDISRGEALEFPGAEGASVFAQYYPPRNGHFQGPAGALPPAILTVHGGPTGSTDRGLKLKTQYWTGRGFAVLDVDYSGSTGYGRAYRDRLDGAWGIRDVADMVAAARYLAESGRADRRHIVISGGSAGGFTVLLALATGDTFAAGACYYGVSDLAQLLAFTHKFESGYLYRLMGVGPDDWQQVFRERSPLSHVDEISQPIIFFQGLEDKVVPPDQSRMMVEALRTRGIPVRYHEFEDEHHGFRRAETICQSLEAELAFYVEALQLAENK